MTAPRPLPGQLTLFAPTARIPTAPVARRRRKPQRLPKWVGPGRCRSCDHRLPLYQATGQLFAWSTDANALVTKCPGCGVALTTTTTTQLPEETDR